MKGYTEIVQLLLTSKNIDINYPMIDNVYILIKFLNINFANLATLNNYQKKKTREFIFHYKYLMKFKNRNIF